MWLQLDDSLITSILEEMNPVECQIAEKLIERINHYKTLEADPMTAGYRAAAMGKAREGSIEVDDLAVVSGSEHGAYVMAWMWVPSTPADDDDGDDGVTGD